MDPASIIQGAFFLVQLVVGSLGNLTVLLSYLYVGTTECIVKPVDVIVSHLTLVNLIALVTRSVPQVMALFGLKEFLNDAGCKTVLYIYRITRALSVSTTCTLSVFQSVTIAPVTSQWGMLKHTLPKYLIHSFVFFWILNFLASSSVPLLTAAPKNNTVPPNTSNIGFCYTSTMGHLSAEYIITAVLNTGQEVLLIVVMILANGYILLTLKRHRQQVQYIQCSSQNLTKTIEAKAAKTIMKLVALYASIYAVDVIMTCYESASRQWSALYTNARVFISLCYQFQSPFILISLNKKAVFRLPCGKKDNILST